MSTNVVKVNGDYKIKAAQGGNISLDAGPTGNIAITGNLNVYGAASYLNTTNTDIYDNVIVLNKGEQTNQIHLGEAGIEIDRGPTNIYGNAQLSFVEGINWADPIDDITKTGLFVFKTRKAGICGIQTVSINTNGNDLYLINSGSGVISVTGTVDYETNVKDDDHIPNKKYVDTRIASGGGGKVTFTQPETAATLTLANNKTLTVNNNITFNGTEGTNPVAPCTVNFAAGGTVAYRGSSLAQFNTTTNTELLGVMATSSVTGTGKLVFDNNPTFSGNITFGSGQNAVTITSTTGTGAMVLNSSPTITTSVTILGNYITGVTGGNGAQAANLVLSNSPTITGTPTIGGQKVNAVTGTTNLVFSNSPTLVTPALGVASATSINKVSITAPTTAATITIANNKTFTVNNTIAFSGVDETTITFNGGGTVAFTTDYVAKADLTNSVAAIKIPDATLANSNTAKNIGFLGRPINVQTSGYILQFGDQGKTIYTGADVQIPANATVPLPVGAVIHIIANAAIAISIVTDTLQWGGQATNQTGTRYLAKYGTATLTKVTDTLWFITGSIIT